uniref:Putative ovule protein n=1 Tax=Solanum chacoense TaxID=4108 RepID=A0A0V0HM10_SOLCH
MFESFQLFSKALGLQENMSKCSIYFGGVSSIESAKIIQYTGFTAGQLPFKYLGIPLSTKKLSLMQWSPLIEKIVAKISSWTTRKLSHAG